MLWHKAIGAGGAGGVVLPTLTFHGFHYVDGTQDNGNYTFSGVDIGTADANRYIITAVGVSNDTASVSNITVAGTSSSFVSSVSDGNTDAIVGLTQSPITTGSTADIEIVLTTGQDFWDAITLGVYSLTLPSARIGSSLGDFGVGTSGTFSDSIACEAGDAIIAVLASAAGGNGANGAGTVGSPLTKDYDGYPELSQRAVVGGSLLVTSAGSVSVDLDVNDTNTNAPAAVGRIRLSY
jgi:hypothetical protein